MATPETQELVDRFEQFFRRYYSDEIGELARRYPREQRSLHVDWTDLYQFDPDVAEDFRAQPGQLRECAEQALANYDLPVDVNLEQAHVRVRNLSETTDIRAIRSRHVNTFVAIQGMIRKATDVRPKIVDAAFECQVCGTLNSVPQSGEFQEPHECEGCDRQGPFSINFDQSEFVDAQQLRVQESPEGLRGGETPQSIDVHVEDDLAGEVSPGDHVTVTGTLRLEQRESGNEDSTMFDVYMDGSDVVQEDEEFEDMEITDDDLADILELSNDPDVYQRMVESVAPSIHGYEEEKLAMVLQLFSGVTKHLPDESRIRGDLHMLLIGDPGTGKCIAGTERVTLADGREVEIRELVEAHLDDPTPVDDGVYDEVDFEVPSLAPDGSMTCQRATKVWKREAPEQMYHVRMASGRTIEVTPSHPLFVRGGTGPEPRTAAELSAGDFVATPRALPTDGTDDLDVDDALALAPDGGAPRDQVTSDIAWDRIEQIERVDTDDDWVYDLEVAGTHSYVASNVVSHNSQLLQYIRHIAPRSVYTSGKGSSAAGLTAAAVRDDFGDGQQWTLEAGALVLADRGVAAIDELDKMAEDDRSAMHEALEQQEISISKAGINATMKARCSLLGAANPKYGRFDQYEEIGEQIDLEPALISRFDLIFTVTDQPDEEEDRRLAEHILQTNYAGELGAQRAELNTPNVSEADVEAEAEPVEPPIDTELFRKYIAHARSTSFPTMTEEAREAIEEFYVDLRSKGEDEDAPVPVTARKLEALIRLAEASARVRLADEVTAADAERVIDIVRSSLQDVGVDPETGEFDADVVETGTSKSQRDRIKTIKQLIEEIEQEYEDGAPVEAVLSRADEVGMDEDKAEHEIEQLRQKGEVYEPSQGHLRTT
ncbi:MAG: ATP-binding protein [Halobacteriaceae archaeon]